MNCCGKKRTTKFCPDCGSELRGTGPSHAILMHLKTHLKIKRSGLKSNLAKQSVTAPERQDYYDESIRRYKIAIAKWEEWEAWVLEMIEKSEASA